MPGGAMRVLITGITGTLGKAVSSLLLDQGHYVIGISRDEQKQKAMPKHDNLKLYIGDVRDFDSLVRRADQVNVIFHFAALKHVDLYEHQPDECVQTNVIGTQNIVDIQQIAKIDRVVLSSTDKACYPINAYGATKALAEKIVISADRNNIVCRYGNVASSRGSVIPFFDQLIRQNKTVPITNGMMTRFFTTIEEASKFVSKHLDEYVGLNASHILSPSMKACRIIDLMRAIAKYRGKPDPKFEIVGLRPGEKIHEVLRMEHEPGGLVSSDRAERFSDVELERLVATALKESA